MQGAGNTRLGKYPDANTTLARPSARTRPGQAHNRGCILSEDCVSSVVTKDSVLHIYKIASSPYKGRRRIPTIEDGVFLVGILRRRKEWTNQLINFLGTKVDYTRSSQRFGGVSVSTSIGCNIFLLLVVKPAGHTLSVSSFLDLASGLESDLRRSRCDRFREAKIRARKYSLPASAAANLSGNLVTTMQAGAIAGAMISSPLAEKKGRKPALLVVAVAGIVGGLMQGLSFGHLSVFYIGR